MAPIWSEDMNRRDWLAVCGAMASAGLTLTAAAQQETAADTAAERNRQFWNNAFANQGLNTAPNRFLASVAEQPAATAGEALDIGMGLGRNALYLAQQHWRVTGVDVSDVAIARATEEAARRKVALTPIRQAIETFDLGRSRWQLVCEMYMHRLDDAAEATRVAASLTSGGLLVVEGFHDDVNIVTPFGGRLGYRPNQLVQALTPALRVLHYEEVVDFPDWGNEGQKVPLVRLLARKP